MKTLLQGAPYINAAAHAGAKGLADFAMRQEQRRQRIQEGQWNSPNRNHTFPMTLIDSKTGPANTKHGPKSKTA